MQVAIDIVYMDMKPKLVEQWEWQPACEEYTVVPLWRQVEDPPQPQVIPYK